MAAIDVNEAKCLFANNKDKKSYPSLSSLSLLLVHAGKFLTCNPQVVSIPAIPTSGLTPHLRPWEAQLLILTARSPATGLDDHQL